MAEEKSSSKKPEPSSELMSPPSKPLVFISHDSRDAELAEGFSKLLKSISAGMLKSFRSSDKKGTEGIEFGDEWYKSLMSKLECASDVVCLFTERSLDRPWILYEAGVAKGKLNTPVHGIALGIPLKRVSTGPFYQFQNSDDSEESITKLVMQLARRIPSLEPDKDVVATQVQNFKTNATKILKKLATPGQKKDEESKEDTSTAKLFEEVKVMVRDLPSRIEDRIASSPIRRKRLRHFHPMMFEEILHMSGISEDPIGILFLAGIIRDDFPWYYEILIDTYHAVKSGDNNAVDKAINSLRNITEICMKGPFAEEFLIHSKELHMMAMEMPHLIDRLVKRYVRPKRTPRKSTK